MTYTLVQAGTVATAAANVSSVTAACASTTSGNLLVALLALGTGSSASVATLPAGWVQAVAYSGNFAKADIWYYANCPAGITSVAVSWTQVSTLEDSAVQILEFHDSAGSATAPLDATSTVINDSVTPATIATSSATAASGELAVAAYAGHYASATKDTITAGSGFTQSGNWGNAVKQLSHLAFDYQAATGAAGVITDSMAFTGSFSAAAGAIATFKVYTPPAFLAAGTLASNAATALASLAHTNVAAGNCLILGTKITTTTITVTGVSGGGATGWTRIAGPNNDGTRSQELWMGRVTATGAQTISLTYSGSVAAAAVDLDCQEFSSPLGAAAVWTRDTSGWLVNSASTTVTYPTLAPARAPTELYVGQSRIPSGITWSGLTAGFTGQTDVNGNRFIHGLAVTGSVSPSEVNATSAASGALAALITDVAPSAGPARLLAARGPLAAQPSPALQASFT